MKKLLKGRLPITWYNLSKKHVLNNRNNIEPQNYKDLMLGFHFRKLCGLAYYEKTKFCEIYVKLLISFFAHIGPHVVACELCLDKKTWHMSSHICMFC